MELNRTPVGNQTWLGIASTKWRFVGAKIIERSGRFPLARFDYRMVAPRSVQVISEFSMYF